MDIKQLNEHMVTKLHELDMDPSFKDYMDNKKADYKQQIQKDMDMYKKYMEVDPDDTYYAREYADLAKKLSSKTDVDKLLKAIYDCTNIDLQTASIKPIDIPTSAKQILQILDGPGKALLLQIRSRLAIITVSRWDKEAWIHASFSDNKIITSTVYDGSTNKRLDLSARNSLVSALRKGLFTNAWLLEGTDTRPLQKQRMDNFAGSDDSLRDTSRFYSRRDKSGYLHRDLKDELLKLTKDARKNDFEKVKQQVDELRKTLISKIKTSELDDYDVDKLYEIINALKEVTNMKLNDWSLDTTKESKRQLELKLKYVSHLIDEL